MWHYLTERIRFSYISRTLSLGQIAIFRTHETGCIPWVIFSVEQLHIITDSCAVIMYAAVCKISFHDLCFVALQLTLMSCKAFFLFQRRTKGISMFIMFTSTIWFSFSKNPLCDKDTKRSHFFIYSIPGILICEMERIFCFCWTSNG